MGLSYSTKLTINCPVNGRCATGRRGLTKSLDTRAPHCIPYSISGDEDEDEDEDGGGRETGHQPQETRRCDGRRLKTEA